MTPRTSILLPVHNGARYLEEQIGSILSQSAGDFELLTLDDGSRDDSAALLSDLARQDRRIRMIGSSGNRGQDARLAELLDQASGHFVMIADQDDIWHPDRNERLIAAIGDKAVAFGRSDLIDGNGRPLGRTLLQSLNLTPDPDARVRTLFMPLVSAHGAVARRTWIDRAIFSHPMPFDWLMSVHALYDGGLAYCDGAVVMHRIHGANQMNRAAPDAGRPLGALRNRLAFLARRPARLRFWLILDYLGRVVPDGATRAALSGLARDCRVAWFGRPALRVIDTALRQNIMATLRPLAGSETDWCAIKQEIDRLTLALPHPAILTDVFRSAAGRT